MKVILRSLPAILGLGSGLIWIVASVGLAQEPEPRPGPRQGPGAGPGPEGREGRFGRGMPPMPVMQALDTDGDGELSAKEIENATAALKTLDKDNNGKLTSDEIRPAFGGFGGRGPGGPGGPGGGLGSPEDLVNRMMAFDKNSDGKLAKDELPERMQNIMDRADANKDGFLDKAELTAYATQQLRNAPGREGPGRPEGRGNGGPGGPRGGGGESRKGASRPT